MSRNKFISLALLSLGIFLAVLGCYKLSSYSIITPQSSANIPLPSSPPVSYRILGFLPYWNVTDFNPSSLSHLTDLAYFALEPNPDGTLATSSANQESYLGYRWLNRDSTQAILTQAQNRSIHTHLVVKLFDPKILESLCLNQAAQATFIGSLSSFLTHYHFSGLNLDYEPLTDPTPATINACTQFFASLSSRLKQSHPQLILSLDVLGKAGENDYHVDLARWEPYFDYFILMTYDYYQAGSPLAGPISPLYADNQRSHTLLKNLKSVSLKIPLQKLVLGLPFYGYRWQTTDSQFLSSTYPRSASMLSYQKINQLIESSPHTLNWNSVSLTPFIVETINDKFYQTHFENPSSLTHKLKLITDAHLAGVAIWAIGYEGNYLDIWQPIESLRNSPSFP